jgi:DNA-binding NarL/FixJ family response regulator
VAMSVSTKSRSPNGPANSEIARIGVEIAIRDPELAARIRSELDRSTVLVEAYDAALILSERIPDRTASVGGARPWATKHPTLSPREHEVAGLLLEGASNKAIARRLDISVHTAKFHVAQILDKLGARNRADAVSIILRDGLVKL